MSKQVRGRGGPPLRIDGVNGVDEQVLVEFELVRELPRNLVHRVQPLHLKTEIGR